MKLLDGRNLAERKIAKLKRHISTMQTKPALGAILVGDDPSSRLYLSIKKERARELGIAMKTISLPSDISEEKLAREIEKLNDNKHIQGILLQLPLPAPLSADNAVARIKPSKDVDGFHKSSGVAPPLILAIYDLLRETKENLKGKGACLFTKSEALHRAIKEALAREGIRIISDPRKADIIITAIGRPSSLKASMIKKGAIVIDVGITRKGKRVRGDAAPDVRKKAGYLSPVPGGVGPLTVVNLFSNLVELSE